MLKEKKVESCQAGVVSPIAFLFFRCYNETKDQYPQKELLSLKYLRQFLIITAFSLAGEVAQRMIPISIPASVYGIFLLFGALCLGIVKVESVRDAGGFLSSILPILFVPPVIGILENWQLIKPSVPVIFLLSLISTITTFAVSGRFAQWASGKGGENRD